MFVGEQKIFQNCCFKIYDAHFKLASLILAYDNEESNERLMQMENIIYYAHIIVHIVRLLFILKYV